MTSAVGLSKRIGWNATLVMSLLRIASGCMGAGSGCLSSSTFMTVMPEPPPIASSNFRGPDYVSLVSSCKVVLILPSIITWENL